MGALGPAEAIRAAAAAKAAAGAARAPVTYPTAAARPVTWNAGLKLSPRQVALLQAVTDYHATWPLDASGRKALLSPTDTRIRQQKMNALMRAYDASMTPAQRAFRAAYYKAHKSAGGLEGLPWDDLAKGLGQVLPVAAGIVGALLLAPVVFPAAASGAGAAVQAAGAAAASVAGAATKALAAIPGMAGKSVAPSVVADTAKTLMEKTPGLPVEAALQQAGSAIVNAAARAAGVAAPPVPALLTPVAGGPAAPSAAYPAPVPAGFVPAALPAWALPAAAGAGLLVLIMTKGGR